MKTSNGKRKKKFKQIYQLKKINTLKNLLSKHTQFISRKQCVVKENELTALLKNEA